MSFAHLHVHTEYSLLDGACRIRDAVKKVKNDGMSALAITDHGVMYGAVEFYKACRAEGIKPIVGCEVYVAPGSRHNRDRGADGKYHHLVLLCKNESGYKNLIKMVSLGFTEGFYSKPRIDMELLHEYHEGLVALSGCLGGYVPQKILEADVEAATLHALEMKSLFGEDYYFELQRHGIAQEDVVNEELVRLSKKLSVPLVATNDAHYVEKSDAQMQSVLMCIQMQTTLASLNRGGFEKDEFYLKTPEQMQRLFSDVPEAVENTLKIADKCNFDFEFDKLFLPAFTPPDNLSCKDYLEKKCLEGLKRRLEKTPDADIQVYKDRLSYELSVVNKMGYDEYYLIVYDFIAYAKGKGIPVGPGRGSGAGSLAAFCLGITDVDPIKHELLFERFLNPERVSMPDFDVDFCYFRRSEVIDYVAEKYGKEHVAQIVTFGTLAARAAIRDVGRVLGMPYSEVDAVAKLVPRSLGITIEGALEENAELRTLVKEDMKVGTLVNIAKKIEGMPRNTSTHAAGVVITDRAVSEYVPLSSNGEAVVTQYTMNEIADLGLLKIDFLGLRYLTVIHEAAKNAGIEVGQIPLDDKETYKLLSAGDTDGVFQLESGGMRSLLLRMKPQNIEDITIAISLYRPGPMDSIPRFLENRKNKQNIKYPHPALEPILSVTDGCIVYQEQVMQIFRTLAGYSFGRADIVRRAMSKKKKEVMDREREYFVHGKLDENGNVEVEGAVARGVDEKVANEIYDDMATFAQYAFNKSHAACYAYLAYYSAYLKCHYPKHYMASLLTSVINNTDKVMEYINACRKMGVSVEKPDVNTGEIAFSAADKGIVFGLMAIKNVGESFVREIIKHRSGGKYVSLEDFLTRLCDGEINKRMVESLIKAGALDSLGHKRSQLLAVFNDAVDALQRRNSKNVEGQFDMFSSVDTQQEQSGSLNISYPEIPELAYHELLSMEKEMTGLYISGHPLDRYSEHSKRMRCDKLADINKAAYDGEKNRYHDGKTVTLMGLVGSKKEKLTRNNDRMAFAGFEDETGEIELVIFPKVYEPNAAKIVPGSVLGVVGEISSGESKNDSDDEQREEKKILVRSIFEVKEDALAVKEQTVSRGDAPENAPKVRVNLSSLMNAAGGNNMPSHDFTPKGNNTADCDFAPTRSGAKNKDLYIRLPGENAPVLSRVRSVLEIYSYGKSGVYIFFEDAGKLVRAVDTHVLVTDTMLEALTRLLGEQNVKLKDNK